MPSKRYPLIWKHNIIITIINVDIIWSYWNVCWPQWPLNDLLTLLSQLDSNNNILTQELQLQCSSRLTTKYLYIHFSKRTQSLMVYWSNKSHHGTNLQQRPISMIQRPSHTNWTVYDLTFVPVNQPLTRHTPAAPRNGGGTRLPRLGYGQRGVWGAIQALQKRHEPQTRPATELSVTVYFAPWASRCTEWSNKRNMKKAHTKWYWKTNATRLSRKWLIQGFHVQHERDKQPVCILYVGHLRVLSSRFEVHHPSQCISWASN